MPTLPIPRPRPVLRPFALALLAAALALGTWRAAAWDATRLLEVAASRGSRVLQQARAVQQLVERAAGLGDIEAKLAAVNQFYNQRIAFAEDMTVWGVVDHWATPLEALEKGRGDCEDYAIAKYVTLRAAGVPDAQLRLVYVRAQVGGRAQAHMVLAHALQPGDEPVILDNLVSDVRPASLRPDLAPVFSFNADGLWDGVSQRSAGNPLVRLSQWREALARIQAEGF